MALRNIGDFEPYTECVLVQYVLIGIAWIRKWNMSQEINPVCV